MFYRSLGKDAEGIAVLALIELILKYDGADFANWPGLARCKVHFALFDAMQKQGQIWENEAQVMMLLFAQELKPSEAAKRLGCSVRNVTKHRLKALDKLRGLL